MQSILIWTALRSPVLLPGRGASAQSTKGRPHCKLRVGVTNLGCCISVTWFGAASPVPGVHMRVTRARIPILVSGPNVVLAAKASARGNVRLLGVVRALECCSGYCNIMAFSRAPLHCRGPHTPCACACKLFTSIVVLPCCVTLLRPRIKRTETINNDSQCLLESARPRMGLHSDLLANSAICRCSKMTGATITHHRRENSSRGYVTVG